MKRDYYLRLFEDFPALIWRSGLDGRCDYFNRTWLEFTGRTLEQEMGEGWTAGVHPDDLPSCLEQYLGAFHARQPFEIVYRLRRHDGEYRWILDYGRPFLDEHGQFAGFIGSCYDVTDRRRTEEALREAEARYRLLAERATDIIWQADYQGRLTYVSQAIRRYGYEPELCIGRSLLDFVCPADRPDFRRHFAEMVSSRLPQRREASLLTAAGQPVPFEVALDFVHDHEERPVVQGIARDITDRRRVEDRLKTTLAELACSNEDLEQFAYVASHDLQEPLRMVIGYLELLQERHVEALDDSALEFISYAVDGAVRMKALIESLLEYSRLHRDGRPFAPVDCDTVVEQALRNLRRAVEEAGAEITCGPLPQVNGDADRLVQLFQNLLGNALKFHSSDACEIVITAEPRGHEWLFSVADNGIGIAPDHHESIFAPFRRLHSREAYAGTGIGLAACRKIVERHGGVIWVESEPGHGSTFCFSLPTVAPSAASPCSPACNAEQEA